MKQVTVYLLSLGCSKNLVDSEIMSGALKRSGYVITDDPAQAQVIIVNTCGFIEAAQQESIEAILDLAEYKQQGSCRLLLAVGCMVEKFAGEMAEAMPEIDGFLGVNQYQDISKLVAEKLGESEKPAPFCGDVYLLRDLPKNSATAYLKIAEGCDNRCSYCLIPQLRGGYVSRPMEDVLAEARRLLEHGAKELVVIAQDTTCYGYDLYGKESLPELLEQLAALPFAMIRLLYAYPDRISERLIQVMSEHENICHYLDMPIQHASGKILRAMGRWGDSRELLALIGRLRAAMPDIALRTTVMVGFPGEDEDDFQELLAFLAEARFDWVGCFPYYQEADTPAAEMPDQLEAEVKQERLDQVMSQAAELTAQALAGRKGAVLSVLAEGEAEEPIEELTEEATEGSTEDPTAGSLEKSMEDSAAESAKEATVGWENRWYVGRSPYQAPEVDGLIYFNSEQPVKAGQLYQIRVTDSDIYDLIGEMSDESAQ